jgi:hypothetical protein
VNRPQDPAGLTTLSLANDHRRLTTPPSTSRFSRRALLRSGLVGFGLVLVSGTSIALRSGRPRRLPPGGLRVLTPAEYATFAAIADRVCPDPRPGVPGATALDVAGLADQLFVRASDDAREGIKTALAIFENGLTGALFFERVTPFTALSPEDQDRTLLAFRNSRVAIRRTLYRALSNLAASIYYGHPDTWEGIGYGGPPDLVALRAAYAPQLVDYAALRPTAPGGR